MVFVCPERSVVVPDRVLTHTDYFRCIAVGTSIPKPGYSDKTGLFS